MKTPLILSAVRTPVGRHGGALATVRADDLAAVSIRASLERADCDTHHIEDVIFGCANQSGEDNRNVARMAGLLAGLPVEVPGQTINRLCGSGLQAIATAANTIKVGEGDALIAGGVESMTRAPYVMLKHDQPFDRRPPDVADTTVGWRFVNPKMSSEWTISLGATAEKVALEYGVTRADQDAFAYESQQRTKKALDEGVFVDEITPVEVTVDRKGTTKTVDTDEHPRPDVTLESLAKLKPAFATEGTVTAGTSSGINDGSAALILAAEGSAAAKGHEPMARVVATAVAGVDPAVMGIGPVPATRKVLERAGLSVSQLDLIELNEAFAAQAVACIRELDLDPAKVNIYGGAIAHGHPLGGTGAKVLTTLVHALRRTGGRYGLATMCIGVGQGIAVVVERA